MIAICRLAYSAIMLLVILLASINFATSHEMKRRQNLLQNLKFYNIDLDKYFLNQQQILISPMYITLNKLVYKTKIQSIYIKIKMKQSKISISRIMSILAGIIGISGISYTCVLLIIQIRNYFIQRNLRYKKFIPIHKFQQYAQIRHLLKQLEQQNHKINTEKVIQILLKFYVLTACQSDKKKLGERRLLNYQNKTDNYYKALLNEYRDQIPQIFSQLSKIVLNSQNSQTLQIPFLVHNQNRQIQMSKEKVLYFMSLMALNLVPPQPYHKLSSFNSNNNFSFIFDHSNYKTKTIVEYFKAQVKKKSKREEKEKQLCTITRKVISQDVKSIIQNKRHQKMIPFKLQENNASIEQFYGDIKVDFANKFIGGGALSSGCVQEEIMFANHPELYISSLFCQVMKANQAIYFSGFKKYSKNLGYGRNTSYGGSQLASYNFDEKGIVKQYITAIDAQNYSHRSKHSQFSSHQINRQILKAFSGFSMDRQANIVTGNWGCGVFGGDVKLKFLIQWIACSLAGKQMIYCPYGQKSQIQRYSSLFENLNHMSVNQVYKRLIENSKRLNKAQNSIDHLQNNIFKRLSESI